VSINEQLRARKTAWKLKELMAFFNLSKSQKYDNRGVQMWNRVMGLLNPLEAVGSAGWRSHA
jgi:hypothetical protein